MKWTFLISPEKLELMRIHGATMVTGAHGLAVQIEEDAAGLTLRVEIPEDVPNVLTRR